MTPSRIFAIVSFNEKNKGEDNSYMRPVYITPRVFGRFYTEKERQINVDKEMLLVLPDGTPCRIAYLSVDKHGSIVLQAKPQPIEGYVPS